MLLGLLGPGTPTLYLTGPIAASAAFAAATCALRHIGAAVRSPFERSPEAGLREGLEADVEALLGADAVVRLPGWEDSPPSVVEVILAEALAKPVFDLADVLALVPLSA